MKGHFTKEIILREFLYHSLHENYTESKVISRIQGKQTIGKFENGSPSVLLGLFTNCTGEV